MRIRIPLNKRERLLAFAAGAVVFFSLIYQQLLVPLLARNSRLSKEIIFLHRRLAAYRRLLGEEERIRSQYSGVIGQAAAGSPAQITRGIFSELEGLARSCGVEIVDIKPQAPGQVSARASGTIIELRTEGSLAAHARFIYDIGHSASLLQVRNIQLSSQADTAALEGNLSIISPSQ